MEQTDRAEAEQKQPSKKAWLAPDAVQLDAPQHDRIVLELPAAPQAETPQAGASEAPQPAPAPVRKLPVKLLAGVAGALAIIVGIAGVYSINHSLLPVQVANLAPTHQPAGPAFRAKLESATRNYRLTVLYPDGTKKAYALQDAGLTADIDGTLHTARTKHSLRFWSTIHVPLALTANPQKLQAFIDSRATLASTQPQDAKLEITAGKTTITAEKAGSGSRLPDARVTLVQWASTLNMAPLGLSKGDISPAVTATSLAPLKTQVDAVLAQHIKLTIHDKTADVSASDIGGWLTIQPDATGKLRATVNQAAVKTYLEQQAAPYTGATPDTVTPTSDGSTVQVVEQQGNATVTNEQSLIDQLSAHLLDAKGQTLAMQIDGTPGKTVTMDAPAKWLLVNLTTKRMYAYEGTDLVRSFLVSAGAPATPTVVGTYKIYAKYASQDMRGENADGTDYFQPNVQYVNYFYKDYAVHGNYWRPLSYFGNVNSSHGCVGIVNSDAQWVYNWAPIGTTVVTHV